MASRALLRRSVLLDIPRNIGCSRFSDHSSGSTLPKVPAKPKVSVQELQGHKVDTVPTTIEVRQLENVGQISGVPEEHIRNRRVRIYMPPKNSMQSGTNNTHQWQIDFETRQRWENHLIGWASSGDPMSNIKVDFASKEEAIAHCEKMGWNYYVQKPNRNEPKPRSYGQNFAWNKRTRVSTK